MRMTAVALLSLLLCLTVRAGDIPEYIITLPEVDVFIGEIRDISDGKTTIEVYEALFDCYEVSVITVDNFLYMTYDDAHSIPETGDYIAVAALYEDGFWKIAYGGEGSLGLAAKSNGTDPKTLKLYTGGYGFTERMNGYINDGTYSYENRKRLMSVDEEKGAEAGRVELDTDDMTKKIALETEIVVAAPKKGNGGGLFDKPAIRYTFITLFSAAVAFAMSKSVVSRGKR